MNIQGIFVEGISFEVSFALERRAYSLHIDYLPVHALGSLKFQAAKYSSFSPLLFYPSQPNINPLCLSVGTFKLIKVALAILILVSRLPMLNGGGVGISSLIMGKVNSCKELRSEDLIKYQGMFRFTVFLYAKEKLIENVVPT